jgi:hypothetical protein
MTGFTPRTVTDEAWRNLRASPVRATTSAVLAFLLGVGVLAWSGAETHDIERTWHAQRVAGAFVWEVRASWTDGLSATRCDGLRAVRGVVSAGGVMESSMSRPATAPGTRVPRHVVTPGLPVLIWPDEPGAVTASLSAGRGLAEELGWSAGSLVVLLPDPPVVPVTDTSPLHLDHAAVVSARLDGFDAAVVETAVPSGRVDTCLVEASPGADQHLGPVLHDWFDEDDGAVAVRFHRAGDLERDPDVELRRRTAQWGPLLGGGVLSGLGMVTWWARRSDLAVYRMLGLRRAQVLRMVLVEVTATVVLPAQLGATLVVAASGAVGVSGAVARVLLVDDVRLVLVLSAAPLACLLAATSLVAWDALRGR